MYRSRGSIYRVAVMLKYRNGYWARISDMIADRKLDPCYFDIPHSYLNFEIFFSLSFPFFTRIYQTLEIVRSQVYIFLLRNFTLEMTFFLQTAEISWFESNLLIEFFKSYQSFENFRDNLIFRKIKWKNFDKLF